MVIDLRSLVSGIVSVRWILAMSALGLGRVKTTAEFCRIWFGDEILSDEQFWSGFRWLAADKDV